MATFGNFFVDSCLDNLFKKFKDHSKTSLFCNLAMQLRCNLYRNTLDYLIEKLSKYEGNVIMYSKSVGITPAKKFMWVEKLAAVYNGFEMA